MRLSDIKEIKKHILISGSVSPERVLPYRLTHWCAMDEIQFAIDQLKQYSADWQLRKRLDDKFAIYTNHAINSEENYLEAI